MCLCNSKQKRGKWANGARTEKRCLEFQCAFTKAIRNLFSARHLKCFSGGRPLSAAILKNYVERTMGTRLTNVTKRGSGWISQQCGEQNKSNQISNPSQSSCSLTEKGPAAREYVLEPESYPFSSNDLLFLPFPPPAPGIVQLSQRSSQMEPFALFRQTRTSQKKKTRLLGELSIRKALRSKCWIGEVASHW